MNNSKKLTLREISALIRRPRDDEKPFSRGSKRKQKARWHLIFKRSEVRRKSPGDGSDSPYESPNPRAALQEFHGLVSA